MADLSQEIGIEPGRGGGRPWGDIYTVATPETDKAVQTLVQHQNQMDLVGARQRQVAKKALDMQQYKLGSNLRPGDEEKFTQLYSDAKNASINLLNNQNKVPIDQYLQLQNDANEKWGKAMQLAAQSKEERQNEIKTLAAINDAKNQGQFIDNAADVWSKRMNLPIDQIGSVPIKDANGNTITMDLTNPRNLLYQSTTDFTPALTKARGTERPLAINVTQPNSSNILTTKFKGLNTAPDFANSLLGDVVSNVGKNNAGKVIRDFNTTYGNINPNTYAATEAAYNAKISDPNYLKAYGFTSPDQLKINLPQGIDNTPTGQAIKFLAMQHVLNNPLTYQGIDVKTNKDIAMQKNMDIWKEKLALGTAAKKDVLLFSDNLKKLPIKEQQNSLEGLIDTANKNAEDVPIPTVIQNLTGLSSGVIKHLKPTQELSAGFTKPIEYKDETGAIKSIKTQPSDIYALPNDNYAVVYKHPDGTEEVVPHTRQGIRDAWEKGIYNTSAATSFLHKPPTSTYNVINPKTGEVIMKVDEAGATKAKLKGYKIQIQ
jgi:hypothetical protein